MPELPEVETICLQLKKNIKEKKIIKVEVFLSKILKNITSLEFKNQLTNVLIKDVKRRAKIIIIELSNNKSLLIHLKLTGRLLYLPQEQNQEKHTHIIFFLDNNYSLRFWDLRQFGYIKIISTDELYFLPEIKSLGPEPLEESFTLEKFKELFKKKKSGKIKSILMDQKFIAGIGNAYADEICFYSKIHPEKNILTLKEKDFSNLHDNIKNIFLQAIENKGSSIDTYRDIFGEEGKYHFKFQVYGRKGKLCFKCNAKIEQIKIKNRSAYFCPNCQK
ncbi:MAG: bifunctional DNA-formamidopyrimidine glycosylase/DNA-(apurinic or apyrimidinic site) lyase [bacterium]